MSRLGLGLGLTKGGLIPFNPLSLDPYLFFDSRSSMIGTLENPTLDLDPANPSTLDVITATRAGVATYTDADGLIQSASPNNTRVDYTQGAELTPTKFQRVSYTDFSQGWTEQTVTSSAGGGYLGQPSLLVERVAGSSQALFYDLFSSSEFEANTNYTLSFYIRGSSGSFTVHADPYPASAISGATALNLTADWQKAVITFNTASHSFFRLQVFMSPSQTNVGDTFEIAMPQVEEGTTASDFVANTTGSPKFISSAVYSDRVPMILCEPSATNLVDYSEDFSQGSWNKNRVTVADNSITSPDGSLNAAKLVETATTATHLTWTQATTTAAAHSFSVFAKAGERKRIGLRDNQIGNSAVFDLESGSVIAGSGGSIAQAANGFFRITLTGTYAAAGTRHEIYVLPDNATTANTSYTGDGTSGLYLWGAQLEAGSVATSYIPTSGGDAAARTRAADDLEISGSAFTDAFNASEGTFYVESVTNSDLSGRYIFQASSSTGNPYSNRYAVYYSDHQNLQRGAVYATKDNVAQFSTLTASEFTVGTLTRSAFSYKTGDYRFSVDGAAELTPSGLKVPSPSINQIHLGAAHDGSVNLNGHIKRLIYWPYHSDSL